MSAQSKSRLTTIMTEALADMSNRQPRRKTPLNETLASVLSPDIAAHMNIWLPEARKRDSQFISRGVIAVYALVDPRNHSICYVGQSCRPYQRMLEHMSETHGGRDELWNGLRAGGFRRPLVRILREASNPTEAMAWEREWVRKFSAAGEPLHNGGPETKRGYIHAEADAEMLCALAKIEQYICGKSSNLNKHLAARQSAALRYALIECAARIPGEPRS